MRRKSLPVAAWPAADRTVWARAQTQAGLFDNVHQAAGWAPSTKADVAQGYGRWLQHLADTIPDALALAPAERITPAAVETYLAALRRTCGPYGLTAYAFALLAMARVLAPAQDWRWLATVKRRLESTCQPHVPAPVHPNTVIDLGMALIADGQAHDSGVARRTLGRDGTILVLATLIPLRRTNLAGLALGHHLRPTGAGWQVEIPAAETKTRRALSYRASPQLTALIDSYLTDIRPLFPGAATTDRLWLSNKGGALGAGALYDMVVRRTHAGLGRPLSPHQLRDAAASFLVAHAPDQTGLARDLLGHSDYRMTERHYVAAVGLDAGARFAEALNQDRAAAEVRRHRRPRRS